MNNMKNKVWASVGVMACILAMFDIRFLPLLVIPLWIMFATRRAFGQDWCRRECGLCVACGYDLTGNTSGVCPECGTEIVKGRPFTGDGSSGYRLWTQRDQSQCVGRVFRVWH